MAECGVSVRGGQDDDTVSIMSTLQNESQSLDEFHRTFKDFQSLKEILRAAYEDSAGCFASISETVEKRKRDELSFSLLSTEDTRAIERVFNQDATILILGQTNCGKSSLANELLGGRYLPTSEIPCTSRIVNLKYSEEEYVRIVDSKDEELKRDPLGHNQRISKEYIVVSEKERVKLDAVKTVVEVGLKNPLLQSGVRLVDAPGLCENDALDKVVQECVKGVLQLIIYVIDGNYGLRLEDRRILGSLYDVAPELSIFYICNKIESHRSAREMDQGSDESSSEDEESEEKAMNRKREGVFRDLVDSGFVSSSEALEKCRYYHSISTREIRKSRKLRKVNEYSKGFDFMKRDFLFFAGQMLKGHLSHAAGRLLQAQIHCFDFFVARALRSGSKKHDRFAEVSKAIADIKSKQEQLKKDSKSLLRKSKDDIQELMKKSTHNVRDSILKTARDMEYMSIKVGDTVGRNELIDQLEKQVQRLVIMKVTHAVLEEIGPKVSWLAEKMTESAQEKLKPYTTVNQTTFSGIQSLLSNTNALTSDPTLATHLSSSHLSWHVAQTWMRKFAKTLTTSYAIGVKVDADWREQVAKETLRDFDTRATTEAVCHQIEVKIDQFYLDLDRELDRVRILNEFSKMQEEDTAVVAKSLSPSLCLALCRTQGILTDLKHDLKQTYVIKNGKRTEIYECSGWKGDYTSVCIRRPKKPTDETEKRIAVLYAISRHLPHSSHILPVLSVINCNFGEDVRTAFVVPRRESDLWTALNSERKSDDFTFEKRLGIANDVAHGCRFLTSQGIPATDLRVTNVILKRENDIFRAEINIIKPADYDVPYPDRKPPFHIAPELYSQKDSDAADTKANRSDIYAFGILLWWLLHGEYSRPSYAQTTEMIKTAVTKQNKNPLSDEEKKVTKRLKVYRKRLTDCWSACRPPWNDIVTWFDPSGGSGSATTYLSDMGPVTESDGQGAGRAEMKAAISAAGKPRGERPDTESSGPERDDLPADPSSIVLDIESDTPAIKSGSKNQGTATDETYTGTYTEGRGSPERDNSTHKKESGTIEMSIDAQQKGSGKPEDGAQTKGRVIPEEDCSTPDMSVGMQKKRKKGGGHPHVDTGTKLNEWSTSEMGSGTKKKESVASEKKSGARKKGKSGANKEGGNKNKSGDAVEVESAARVAGTGDTRATRSGTHGSVEDSSSKTHITEKQAKKLQRGTAAKERGVDDATETTVHVKKKPMMETAV